MGKSPPGLATRIKAIEGLSTVLGGQAFSPLGADSIEDPRDRALANRLMTVAIRRQGHLNEIISTLLERGIPKKSGRFEAGLRIGLTELLFMEHGADHAALFLAVEAIKSDKKSQHLGKLLNGVLRNAQRRAEEFKSLDLLLLFPSWLRERWLDTYGEVAVRAFARAYLEGASLDLTLKQMDEDLVQALQAKPLLGDSVRVLHRDKPVSGLAGYEEGLFWVQDFSAAIPARLLGLPKGARVLDMCAAPGGKTVQLCNYGYDVTAIDVDEQRLNRVHINLERTGFAATLEVADAGLYQTEDLFDAVLLDAPCSATGIFRRHPEVLWHRNEADLHGRKKLQRRLLKQARSLVKPGGTIVYCTCSLEPEEGEAQMQWAQQQGLEPVAIGEDEVGGLNSSITEAGALRIHPGLKLPGDAEGYMDGFFIARFRSVSTA